MGNYQQMQAINQQAKGVNLKLLHAAIRFNALILGLTGGTIAAVSVYVGTHISIAKWGSDSGNLLGLLAIYFPGYSVTGSGAWIGAFWAFLYSGLFCQLSYRIYGRALGARISEILLGSKPTDNPVLKPSILRLHGVSLGLAIGAMSGACLFLSTAWLVVRGTAHESAHAALLANYVPGYSVSILGGLIGAVQMFAFSFAGCLLLAAVYNRIVEFRNK